MAEALSFDSVLDLCRNQHRRIVLALLAEEQRSVTMNDLTETILAYNHHAPVTEASEEVITEIQCQLHHMHLPRLASAGLIDYDTERRSLEPVGDLDQRVPGLPQILDADPDLQRPVEL